MFAGSSPAPATNFGINMKHYALIKYNGGRNALLCSTCRVIIKEDFRIKDIKDVPHYCDKHKTEHN